MIAAGPRPDVPAADGHWPATGSILAALEYATERTARSVGKPDPMLFETALDRLGPGRSLWSATGSTPTWPEPPPRVSTPRSSSPA